MVETVNDLGLGLPVAVEAPNGANGAGSVPPLLAHDIGFLLARLGVESRRRLGDALADRGLRPHHYAVLLLVDERESVPQGEITETLGLDRGSVVGILDELEEGGLAERRRAPEDRRRHVVTLTARGRSTASACRAVASPVEDDLLAPLLPEDRGQLHTLLHRMAAFHDMRISHD